MIEKRLAAKAGSFLNPFEIALIALEGPYPSHPPACTTISVPVKAASAFWHQISDTKPVPWVCYVNQGPVVSKNEETSGTDQPRGRLPCT